jgi:hypothetical protein
MVHYHTEISMRKIIFVFGLFFVFASVSVLCGDSWSHKTTQDKVTHGWLWYEGKLFPECFQSVTVDGVTYVFKTGTGESDNDGYFPVKKPVLPQESDSEISAQELAAGFYGGNGLKKGTPKNWILVVYGKSAAIVDPAKIKDFVAAKKIAVIPRSTYVPDVVTTASP